MTTKINNITSLSIGKAIVGTVLSGSILASSTAFVANFLSNAGYVINKSVSSIIIGTKSFATLILVDGLASATTSIGLVNATAVNILSSSNALAQVIMNGFTQPLQVSNTDTWSTMPVVALDQVDTTRTYNIIQSAGFITAGNNIRTIFNKPFSVGCIPRVFICSSFPADFASQIILGTFDVDNTGFKSCINGTTANYFALGY